MDTYAYQHDFLYNKEMATLIYMTCNSRKRIPPGDGDRNLHCKKEMA